MNYGITIFAVSMNRTDFDKGLPNIHDSKSAIFTIVSLIYFQGTFYY